MFERGSGRRALRGGRRLPSGARPSAPSLGWSWACVGGVPARNERAVPMGSLSGRCAASCATDAYPGSGVRGKVFRSRGRPVGVASSRFECRDAACAGSRGCRCRSPTNVPSGACSGVLVVVCCPRCFIALRDGGRWLACWGTAYVMAREWCLACVGMSDPCSGSDDVSCAPLQSSARVLVSLGRRRFPVLYTFREGIRSARTSRFRLVPRPSGLRRGVDLKASAVFHVPCTHTRARVAGPRRRARSLGCGTPGGYEASASICPETSVPRFVRTTVVPVLVGSSRLGSCGAGVGEECYLVDPASSHMLVSKIKPCMCKYELIQTVKLRMAH